METAMIVYFLKDDKFNVSSSMSEEGVREVVEAFLHGEMGKGRDDREAEVRDEYTIKLGIDFSDDTIYVSDDCGNCGLRDGILMHYLRS